MTEARAQFRQGIRSPGTRGREQQPRAIGIELGDTGAIEDTDGLAGQIG